jgi:cytochrome c oxidase cbb3-type subunit 4
MSLALSIWTVVVAVLFIAIVIWVWSGRNKAKYEEAARIPFNEDDDNGDKSNTENLNDG